VYPYFRVLSASEGAVVVTVDGKTVVMLRLQQLLGLTHHPKVLAAAHEAIDRFGTGCTGSRFLNGNLQLHETLERELAEFTGREAALVFSSVFLANFASSARWGSIDGAVVFSQADNHASLIDGTRICRGDVRIFHGPEDLERQLSEKERWPEALVVTDAVFSMTGRVMDLRRIADLRRRFGFRLYVDDAHGFGVLGRQGRGTIDAQGVAPEVDLLFATFSKSLASLGGFVAGERPVIEYLRHRAHDDLRRRLPPSSAAPRSPRCASCARRLASSAARERGLLPRRGELLGYHTLGSTTPIVPLFVGPESGLPQCREALELGVFAPRIYPAVRWARRSSAPRHARPHPPPPAEGARRFRARMDVPGAQVDANT
jgi:7-keto-8-aminopelargonate synthetase-like enzyme